MPLALIAGPANAGKVALLLDRYLAALARDPVLLVPNGSDVERVERELLRSAGCLLGGSICTFDDLFARLARGDGSHRPPATDAQRALVVRRAIPRARLATLAGSARFAGFADALGATLAELESGLLEPEDVDGDLAALYRAYRDELDDLGLCDRDLERVRAAERVAADLDAWDGRPVFAYGFEDLTGAQWGLLEALAGRTEVAVSLAYEPGRTAFASLRRTADDLAALAGGALEELPPAYDRIAPAALAHVERSLFSDTPPAEAPPIDGAVRFFEAAGLRGSLELVADDVCDLLREGVPAERIALVCPSVERVRVPLETAFGALGVPYALDGRVRLLQTPFGAALHALLRFAWLGGGRRDLYAYLRSPYSGLARSHVDYLEGRLRGRAVDGGEAVEAESVRLRGQPLPLLDALRAAPEPLAALREAAASLLRAAHGLEAPQPGEALVQDLRAHEAVAALCEELAGWERLAGPLSRHDAVAALESATLPARPLADGGRVQVLDLLRARTRRFDVVYVLGLEEGTLPRRAAGSPFLDDDGRRELERRSRRARLERPDPVSRERFLFYAACTRASRRLVLVREAATDDGAPREPGPFWDGVRSLFPPEDAERWTRRRPLSHLVWPLETAPTERERLRATAALAARDADGAWAVARAHGWERRLERAERAFRRATRLRHPLVLEELRARTSFGVTELEVFAECSSMWLVERLVSPRRIDAEIDAKLRGSVAHQALFRFYGGLPKRLGTDGLHPEQADEAVRFVRECLDEAIAGGVRGEFSELERRELRATLERDLEQFVRGECEAETPLVPRRLELSFGNERSTLPGLDLGGFAVSGKIDRVDVDPFSARGIVQDYKSGKTAHSAAQIESELKLQIPLYLLVLRDIVGIEPLGGLYRALSGERAARGLLRAEAREDGVPGFAERDYLDEDAFWGQVERAADLARGLVARLRDGDVRHDPKGGSCPSWCELGAVCRVGRP